MPSTSISSNQLACIRADWQEEGSAVHAWVAHVCLKRLRLGGKGCQQVETPLGDAGLTKRSGNRSPPQGKWSGKQTTAGSKGGTKPPAPPVMEGEEGKSKEGSAAYLSQVPSMAAIAALHAPCPP